MLLHTLLHAAELSACTALPPPEQRRRPPKLMFAVGAVQNLLVNTASHVLKLCDFGSAKQLVRGEPNISYICRFPLDFVPWKMDFARLCQTSRCIYEEEHCKPLLS